MCARRADSRSMRCIAVSTSARSGMPPMRYSSVKPLIPNSGVRSSWLASATKARIRSLVAARAASPASIRSSMPLSAAAKRPSPVRVEEARSGTRRARSPPAMAAAVVSMRRRGRSRARTANQPMTPSSTRSRESITNIRTPRPRIVPFTSSSEPATTMLPGAEGPLSLSLSLPRLRYRPVAAGSALVGRSPASRGRRPAPRRGHHRGPRPPWRPDAAARGRHPPRGAGAATRCRRRSDGPRRRPR